MKIREQLKGWLMSQAQKRPADFIVGGQSDPYLCRWWIIPRNRFFNVYLHLFLRSDDDRALHDHPWASISWLLKGQYLEHTIAHGGIQNIHEYREDDLILRLSPKFAHRLELDSGPVWTLFITGPVVRHWGFHCPLKGWVHWSEFTAADDPGAIGKGCD